jgi:hypothetical protein
MAITRAQQFRQMLEDGGMLVQPSMTGKRPGYRGDDAARASGRTKDGKATERDTTRSAPPSDTPRGDGPASGTEVKYTPPSDDEIRKIFDLEDDREIGETKKAYKQRTKKTFLDTLKKFGLPTQRLLYGLVPNNPNTELAFLSGLTQEQVDALNNKELSDLYGAIKDADFSGDLSFEDALGDKYGKLSFDAFKALSQRGIDTNFQDPQGKFGNMDFAEYAARIKGKPGLLFSGNVGNIETIKNPDGTYSFVEKRGDNGSSQVTDPCLGPNPPAYCFIGGNAPTTPDPTLSIPFRFMNRGGMVEDAPMGGIMDLESTRQMLFLGGIAKSIGKGLKSITRGIKKVAKSPIGKAAILGTIGYGLGGGFGAGGFKFGNLPGMTSLSKKFSGFSLPDILTKNMTGLKVAGLSGLGGALLASLENKDEDDFNIEDYYKMAGLDINAIRGGDAMRFLAEGGSTEKEPVAKKTMPLLDMDGQEMDFRQEGGFVPIGRMEKADDVPARLSKNEFVFTADAVRNAGGGDVDKGAEVMYNTMKNLEAGGEVSEETQGLEGARNMFQTSQRLGEVV